MIRSARALKRNVGMLFALNFFDRFFSSAVIDQRPFSTRAVLSRKSGLLLGVCVSLALTACETTQSVGIAAPEPITVASTRSNASSTQPAQEQQEQEEPSFFAKLLGTAPYAVPVAPPMMPDMSDDLGLGKFHFKEGNYGLAEKHFRLYVESKSTDAEGWLGLAASYDKLKRFELADRAYTRAIHLVGARPEILNNRGYSYLLRRDYAKARKDLTRAKALDPNNPRIERNLELLAAAQRRRT